MARPFAFLTRRRFLRIGLASAAVLGGGAVGGGLWLRGPRTDVDGLDVLNAAEFTTLTNAIAATFGPTTTLDTSGLARSFDAFVADEPAANRRDLRRALQVVEASPVLFGGYGTTFSRLTASERDAWWASWPAHDRLLLRKVSLAFRKFFNLVLYGDPASWSHVGYLGPRRPGDPPR